MPAQIYIKSICCLFLSSCFCLSGSSPVLLYHWLRSVPRSVSASLFLHILLPYSQPGNPILVQDFQKIYKLYEENSNVFWSRFPKDVVRFSEDELENPLKIGSIFQFVISNCIQVFACTFKKYLGCGHKWYLQSCCLAGWSISLWKLLLLKLVSGLILGSIDRILFWTWLTFAFSIPVWALE